MAAFTHADTVNNGIPDLEISMDDHDHESTAHDAQHEPHFRLLKIYPDSACDAPIRGDLIQQPIPGKLVYHALSYAPGNGALDCHVNLVQSETHVAITGHLWKALRRLRQPAADIHVWVDALCTDQASPLERAAQVTNTAQIYSQAQTVRIWLGEAKRPKNDDRAAASDDAVFPSLARQRDPWWKQLWILQHCAFAQMCPVVMLGSSTMSLEDFIMRWFAVMENLRADDLLTEGKTTLYHQMQDGLAYLEIPLELWRTRQQGITLQKSLLVWLRDTYWRHYSEPRDMFYALLSLVDEREAYHFRPDYSVPFPDLWTRAMELCRRSPLWHPGIDDYFFDPVVLEAREATKRRTLSPCGVAIIAEAHKGNIEILPYLLEKRTLSNFQLIDDSKAFRHSKGAREKDGFGNEDFMPKPSLLTKEVLEAIQCDARASARLFPFNDFLYRQGHQYVCGLFELAVVNTLPRTLTTLLEAARDIPSQLYFFAWLIFVIKSEGALHKDGLDTIRLIVSIPDSSFSQPSEWLEDAMKCASRVGKLSIVKLMLENAPYFRKSHHGRTNSIFQDAIRSGNIPIAECILDFIIAKTKGVESKSIESAVDSAFYERRFDVILWLYHRIISLTEEMYAPHQILGSMALSTNLPDQFLARAIKFREEKIIEAMLQKCIEAHVKVQDDTNELPREVAALRKVLGDLVRTGTWSEVTKAAWGMESELKSYEFYWKAIQDATKLQNWTIAEVLLPEAWTPRDDEKQPLYEPPEDIEDPGRFWEKMQYRGRRHESGFLAASGSVDLTANLPPHIAAEFRQYAEEKLQSCDQNSTIGVSSSLYRSTLPGEIRVLELSPGQHNDLLEGRLRHVDINFEPEPYRVKLGGPESTVVGTQKSNESFTLLVGTSQHIPYTALSYCWGPGGLSHDVLLSGHRAKITSEVDAMLRHLRQPHRPITVWLDQLCINQDSDADKAVQVQFMGKIYAQAYNTVVWLGEESDNGAFWALQLLSESLMGTKEYMVDEDLEWLRNEALGDVSFKTIEDFFMRPWFQRTWVVQEAVLSRRPYFMAGAETIAWNDFAGYCVGMKELDLFRRHTTGDRVDQVSGAEILADMYSLRENSQTLRRTFLEWLVDTRYAGAKFGADKVYSLLGVFPIAVIPDYAKSPQEVYHQATTMLIRDEFKEGLRKARGLIHQFFSCVDHPSGTRCVPSWVADWSQPRRSSVLIARVGLNSFYCADGGSEPSDISLSDDGRAIITTARFVSTVRDVSASLDQAELSYEGSRHKNHSLQVCIDFVNDSVGRPAQDLPFETFCATLVAGKDARGFSPQKPESSEILSILCDATTGRSPSIPTQTYTKRQKSGRFDVSNLARRQPGRTFQHLRRAYRNAVQARSLCWTQNGHLGLVPRFTVVGDHVVVMPGSRVPFVLRGVGPGRFTLVGECYVHDVMDGEFMKTATEPLETIAIV